LDQSSEPFEKRAGFVGSTLEFRNQAEDVVRLRSLRRESRGGLCFPLRRRQVRQIEQRNAEIDTGQIQLRIDLQSIPEGFGSFSVFELLEQGYPDVIAR